MKTFKQFLIFESVEKLKKRFHITKAGKGSTGFSEKNQKWYGWSYRAVFGFGIGDKIFEAEYGDDHTKFNQHGSKTCKTLEDCELAAQRFAKHVS